MYNWIAHEDHLVQDKKIRAGVLTCRITVFFHRFTVHQCGLFGSLLPSQNLQGTTHQNHVASLT